MAKFIPERTLLEMEAGREALKRYQSSAPVEEPTVAITIEPPTEELPEEPVEMPVEEPVEVPAEEPPVQADLFEMPTEAVDEKPSSLFTEIGMLDGADNIIDDIDVSSVL